MGGQTGIPAGLLDHLTRLSSIHLCELFDDDPERAGGMTLTAGDLTLDYSKNHLDRPAMAALIRHAKKLGLPDKIEQLLSGGVVNKSENRAAFHAGLRQPSPPTGVAAVDDRVERFVRGIRAGKISGHSGAPFTDIINIGIGGSDLGPRSVVQSLRAFHDGPNIHYVSTVDGAALEAVIKQCDPAQTLILVASKSFSTTETLTNAKSARRWMVEQLGPSAVADHFVALSANPDRAVEFGMDGARVFGFPDWVGGRFSVWSAPIGMSVALAIGWDNFVNFRAGGRMMDDHLRDAPLDKSMPFILGVVDYWYHTVMGLSARAIIPYANDLAEFTHHVQQVSMESLGKSATENGDELNQDSGPVIFGQIGTDAQHAFIQLLHQGSRLIPVDFILFNRPLSDLDPGHHRILNANAVAQARALMVGRHVDPDDANAAHKQCDGNRPSSMLNIDRLTPSTIGQLYALYEHRVAVHGFMLGINPFDQFGVELGKELAKNITKDGLPDPDTSTAGLIDRLGLSKP
jgi:glucose-6-phosphate isomerase